MFYVVLYPKRYNSKLNGTFYTLKGLNNYEHINIYPKRYIMEDNKQTLKEFVKRKRKSLKLTQKEMAEKAGVGLRFVRELERGKETLKMDKVNQVLELFGHELGPQKSYRT